MICVQYFVLTLFLCGIIISFSKSEEDSSSRSEKNLRDVKLAIKVFRQMNVTLNEVINLLEHDLAEGKTIYEPEEMLQLIQ